jgi:hypothetical protein
VSQDGRPRAAAPAGLPVPRRAAAKGTEMLADASGPQHLLLAETLGLAMARRAAEILQRHRAALAGGGYPGGGAAGQGDERFALDNAVFTAVLDAASECLGRFDSRPADDRWCDALLQVLALGQLGGCLPLDALPSPGETA